MNGGKRLSLSVATADSRERSIARCLAVTAAWRGSSARRRGRSPCGGASRSPTHRRTRDLRSGGNPCPRQRRSSVNHRRSRFPVAPEAAARLSDTRSSSSLSWKGDPTVLGRESQLLLSPNGDWRPSYSGLDLALSPGLRRQASMAGPGTLGEPAGGEHDHRRQNVVVTIDVSHVSGVLLRTGGDEQVGNGDPVRPESASCRCAGGATANVSASLRRSTEKGQVLLEALLVLARSGAVRSSSRVTAHKPNLSSTETSSPRTKADLSTSTRLIARRRRWGAPRCRSAQGHAQSARRCRQPARRSAG